MAARPGRRVRVGWWPLIFLAPLGCGVGGAAGSEAIPPEGAARPGRARGGLAVREEAERAGVTGVCDTPCCPGLASPGLWAAGAGCASLSSPSLPHRSAACLSCSDFPVLLLCCYPALMTPLAPALVPLQTPVEVFAVDFCHRAILIDGRFTSPFSTLKKLRG